MYIYMYTLDLKVFYLKKSNEYESKTYLCKVHVIDWYILFFRGSKSSIEDSLLTLSVNMTVC